MQYLDSLPQSPADSLFSCVMYSYSISDVLLPLANVHLELRTVVVHASEDVPVRHLQMHRSTHSYVALVLKREGFLFVMIPPKAQNHELSNRPTLSASH